MRIGNAILTAFFIWLAIYLPRSMYTMSQTYPLTEIYGVSVENWMVVGFLLPLFAACISLVCGLEKSKVRFNRHPDKKPAVIIEKTEDIKKPVIGDFKSTETKPESGKLKIEGKNIKIGPKVSEVYNIKKVHDTKDIEKEVDVITSKKEIKKEDESKVM